MHPTAVGSLCYWVYPQNPNKCLSKIPYLCTDLISTEQPNGQSEQPHHCPLHQEAELHCMDTQMVKVVSDSLPDTGHTVPSHNKKDGKGRTKGRETSRTQQPLPQPQKIHYFLTSIKNSSWEIQGHMETTKPSNFLLITCKAIRWENSPSGV